MAWITLTCAYALNEWLYHSLSMHCTALALAQVCIGMTCMHALSARPPVAQLTVFLEWTVHLWGLILSAPNLLSVVLAIPLHNTATADREVCISSLLD